MVKKAWMGITTIPLIQKDLKQSDGLLSLLHIWLKQRIQLLLKEDDDLKVVLILSDFPIIKLCHAVAKLPHTYLKQY